MPCTHLRVDLTRGAMRRSLVLLLPLLWLVLEARLPCHILHVRS